MFSDSTELYLADVGGEVVGMCGVVWYHTHCKFKNDYIKHEHRCRGYYRQMFDQRLAMARAKGCKHIDATCTDKSLPEWLRRGAVVVRKYRKYTQVRITL